MERTKIISPIKIIIASLLTLALVFAMVPAIGQITTNSDTGFSEKVKSIVYTNAAEKKVTVKFNANKGKVSEKSKAVKKNTKIGKLPKPTRKGYKYKGWYTKKSGGTKYTKDKKVTKNITLYAHWSKVKKSSSSSKSGSYVGASTTGKYHFTSCASAKRINASNRVYFASSAKAKKAGYDPCKTCRP